MSRKRKHEEVVDTNQEEMEDNSRPVCVFCRQSVKNKYYLGKIMTRDEMSAHYYCILMSPGLQQKGSLDDDFKGFLCADIRAEQRRGGHLSCSYCHGKGAVIGCSVTTCKINFHLPCGLVNDSFHSFHDPSRTYPSFCAKHRPRQKVTRVARRAATPTAAPVDPICAICRDKVDNRVTNKTLWSPCCGHWQHRECVMKQAYHAAKHHFKCPNCNNKDVFVAEMKRFGVYVPTRDASWEKGTAFSDLYDQRYECSVDTCLCRKGKAYNGDGEWEILACDGCGANATHIKCSQLAVDTDEWMCSLCKPILAAQQECHKLKTITNMNS